MEFIFVFRRGDFRNWAETEKDSGWYIVRNFLASILNHHVFHSNLLQPSSLISVKVERSKFLPFTSWILKTDNSVYTSRAEVSQVVNMTKEVMYNRFDYFGIELVSPVYSFSSTNIISHLLQIQQDLHIMGHLSTTKPPAYMSTSPLRDRENFFNTSSRL
jgi:hypothetical protein